MFVYIIVFILLFFGFVNYDLRNQTAGKKFFYFLIFVSLILMLGLRYRVGGDSLSYEDYYPGMPTFREIFKYGLYADSKLMTNQPLWIILIASCKLIGKEYYIFQIVHAFIINLLLFFYLKKYSFKPFTVLLFLFVTHFYFYFTIEIQREVLAIGVFLLNIKNLEKKKWISFYLLAIVSFLFHISALFIFFLPLLRILNLKANQVILITLLLTPLIFFKSLIISVLAPVLFLDVMQKKIEAYSDLELSFLGTLYFYLARVIFLLPIILYFFKSKAKEHLWLYYTYIFVAVLSLSLVGFERLLNYLIIPLLVSFIHFIYNLKTVRGAVFNKYVVVVLTLFHFIFNIPMRLASVNKQGQHYYSLFFPYVSIFDKEIIRERENYIINQWDL